MTTALTIPNLHSDLDHYVQNLTRFPLLSREQEFELACRYADHGDISAAHQLVVSNLRFVIKIAYEYRGYQCSLTDLVQEGNIGLMQAVKKFDPRKGYRLITYAVWWIRAFMQSFILKTWSLVKLGSGRIAKRLFFKLRSTRAKLEQELHDLPNQDISRQLADSLGVKASEISNMELRMAARDFSLDTPLSSDGQVSSLDQLPTPDVLPDAALEKQEALKCVYNAIDYVKSDLNEREHHILNKRLLTDDPQTLEEIGSDFGVTRERARQLEKRLLEKIRKKMKPSKKIA